MNATATTSQPRTASERKACALEIAATHGPEMVAIVERMDFSGVVTDRDRAIAESLMGKAHAALARHGGEAA